MKEICNLSEIKSVLCSAGNDKVFQRIPEKKKIKNKKKKKIARCLVLRKP